MKKVCNGANFNHHLNKSQYILKIVSTFMEKHEE